MNEVVHNSNLIKLNDNNSLGLDKICLILKIKFSVSFDVQNYLHIHIGSFFFSAPSDGIKCHGTLPTLVKEMASIA